MDAELGRWLAAGGYFDYLGFDIFYRVEGSGPPLLLIHGYPFNSFDWAQIWPTLTQRFTVIAPDMIGMGFSEKPVAYQYSVTDHADMHEALLAHLNIGTRTSWRTTSVIPWARRCWPATSSVSKATAGWTSTRSPGSTAECSSRPTNPERRKS